jgi:3-oxoadipate CoA-transferase, beta subunit
MTSTTVTPLDRNQLAWRAAQDFPDGGYVNLGVGIPFLAANYLPDGREVMFQSENGVLGVGPLAEEGEGDPDLIGAGDQRITLGPGAVLFDSTMAFAMIRGGHIDVTLLGGFQVSVGGDLANWDLRIPDKGPLLGGAMDLAVGARSVRVVMAHVTKKGEPRLVENCDLPLTGVGVVDRVYTDHAVIDVTSEGFQVQEILVGVSRKQLAEMTGAPLIFASDCGVMKAPTL